MKISKEFWKWHENYSDPLRDIIHGYVSGVIVGTMFLLYWWITHSLWLR